LPSKRGSSESSDLLFKSIIINRSLDEVKGSGIDGLELGVGVLLEVSAEEVEAACLIILELGTQGNSVAAELPSPAL
jgi:hypothetical protein